MKVAIKNILQIVSYVIITLGGYLFFAVATADPTLSSIHRYLLVCLLFFGGPYLIYKFRTKTLAVALCISFPILMYWQGWGRRMNIEAHGKKLNAIVNLECFENIHPDMKKSEVFSVIGVPDYRKAHKDVESEDKDARGTVCIYNRHSGELIYYAPEEDNSDGFFRFMPIHSTIRNRNDNIKNRISDFLIYPYILSYWKDIVEIKDSNKYLIQIKINLITRDVERVSYFQD